jgi:hypothetical protein
MNIITATTILTLGLAASGIAADFRGFIEDEMCAGKPEMRGDSVCAQKCIKGGSAAVLVTIEGQIYKIANQKKILAHAGEIVTVSAKLKGDTITIEAIKE